jgi:hypothetical protein
MTNSPSIIGTKFIKDFKTRLPSKPGEYRKLDAHVEPTRESASDFYARISREYGTDVDLDAVIRADRSE